MTEEEAKTKWCPFARVAIPMRDIDDGNFFAGAAANRVGLSADIAIHGSTDRANPESARCIGSSCMAWRWVEQDETMGPTRVHPNVLTAHWKGWTVTDDTPDERGYVEISPPPPPVAHGFCGLAGKP